MIRIWLLILFSVESGIICHKADAHCTEKTLAAAIVERIKEFDFPVLKAENDRLSAAISESNIENIAAQLRANKITKSDAHIEILKEFSKDNFLAALTKQNATSAADWILTQRNPTKKLKFLKYRFQLEKLGVDPDRKSIPFAKMAQLYGFHNMEHTTSIDNMLAILRSKALAPSRTHGNRYAGGDSNFAYLRVVHKPNMPPFPDEVNFEFSTNILDQFNWSHASPDAYQGDAVVGESVQPSNMFGLILQYIDRLKSVDTGSGNEVTFTDAINLDETEFTITVDSKVRDEILNKIYEEGLTPPQGTTWAEVIRSKPESPVHK